jgi:PKD repeat protein
MLLVAVVTLGATLIPASAGWAEPLSASFTYSPSEPLTGEVVTFTSTSTGPITSETWDLDADDDCDDASGPTVQRVFSNPGAYPIRLCLNGSETDSQSQTVTIRNRPPVASFNYFPAAPVAGEPVTLTSSSADPDGPILSLAWSLDGDGQFDDGDASSTTRVWPKPGVYPVALSVADKDGAVSVASGEVRIFSPEATLLSPFPVVRLVGQLTRTGVQIKSLTVKAPHGARVAIRCRGSGCPYRRAATRSDGMVRFRRMQRSLRAGTVLEISVTERGKIGKYTRFRLRRGTRPARVDRCLMPGVARPVGCPSG